MDHDARQENKSVWKTMTLRQRLEHFWTYYKLHLAAAVLAMLCLIWVGNWLSHRGDETLLYLSLVDCTLTRQEEDDFRAALEELVQLDDPQHQKVILDSSLSFDGLENLTAEARNAQLSKQLILLDTGTADVYLASPDFCSYYEADGWFLPMEEVLGQRYQELSELVTEQGSGLLLPESGKLPGQHPEQLCLLVGEDTQQLDNVRRLIDELIPLAETMSESANK